MPDRLNGELLQTALSSGTYSCSLQSHTRLQSGIREILDGIFENSSKGGLPREDDWLAHLPLMASSVNPTNRKNMLMNNAIKNTNLNRRRVLLALGATAVSFAGLSGVPAADHDHDAHASGPADRCAKACADAMTSCSKHVRHCTQHLADGHKYYVKCLELCVGCLQMCGACVATCFGPMGVTAAEACAKACDLCATECERIEADEAIKVHAKLCRDCAKVCREFSKARP